MNHFETLPLGLLTTKLVGVIQATVQIASVNKIHRNRITLYNFKGKTSLTWNS